VIDIRLSFLVWSLQPKRQCAFAYFNADNLHEEAGSICRAFVLGDDAPTMLLDRLGHGPFDLGGRNTDDRSGRWFGVSAQIGLRHVVSISHAVLGRMGRDHAVTSRIEQEPAQQSLGSATGSNVMRPLLGETLLHSIEQCAVDQRRL
jgi:hypothetical protein